MSEGYKIPAPLPKSLASDIAKIAEQALTDIVACDYRGNEPVEQMIARLARAEIAGIRREAAGLARPFRRPTVRFGPVIEQDIPTEAKEQSDDT